MTRTDLCLASCDDFKPFWQRLDQTFLLCLLPAAPVLLYKWNFHMPKHTRKSIHFKNEMFLKAFVYAHLAVDNILYAD